MRYSGTALPLESSRGHIRFQTSTTYKMLMRLQFHFEAQTISGFVTHIEDVH